MTYIASMIVQIIAIPLIVGLICIVLFVKIPNENEEETHE